MQTPDVVVLVPGFLGFTRFGGFYYFADRLIAVLRGLLEEPLEYPVPVVPVTMLRTDSLANRQGALLQNLAGVCDKLSGVERIHLIGHSTGGVDAQLLACTKTLDGHAWDKKANAVRKKISIRSVNRVADTSPSPAYIGATDETREQSDMGTAGSALDAEWTDG